MRLDNLALEAAYEKAFGRKDRKACLHYMAQLLWTQKQDVGPSARSDVAMVFDTAKPRILRLHRKQGDTVVATATGWQTPTRTRAFVYVPDVPGEIGIMPDRTAVDQKP
jgi:hypothetical protein